MASEIKFEFEFNLNYLRSCRMIPAANKTVGGLCNFTGCQETSNYFCNIFQIPYTAGDCRVTLDVGRGASSYKDISVGLELLYKTQVLLSKVRSNLTILYNSKDVISSTK